MQRSRQIRLFFAAAVLLSAASLFAQPTIRRIEGDPLTINIAADGSFQVFNAAVPGTGQVFPSSNQYGDAGIFADVGGTLFAPAFGSHGGTATGGLGTFTPWSTESASNVTGAGTRGSPLTVTLQLTGGGVSLTHRYEYVNGDNYFRMFSSFTGPTSVDVNVYIGADIYLGGSDAGRFFYEESLAAPGGRDCATPPTYNILIIPLTPAQRYTASGFSDVWAQIGANQLNNTAIEGNCVDNGAAVQWTDILNSGRFEIESAVSFGGIPVIIDQSGFTIEVDPEMVTLLPGESATFDVVTTHNEAIEFNDALNLFAEGVPEGMTVTFDRTTIPAPGTGRARMTVQLSPDTFPTLYRGLAVLATSATTGETHGASITIDVVCDPPFVTALNAPQTQTVRRGSTATLRVRPEQGGAYNYQWFRGVTGMTSSPVANSNRDSITTDPINELSFYWVRITNACGTHDTGAALLIPTN